MPGPNADRRLLDLEERERPGARIIRALHFFHGEWPDSSDLLSAAGAPDYCGTERNAYTGALRRLVNRGIVTRDRRAVATREARVLRVWCYQLAMSREKALGIVGMANAARRRERRNLQSAKAVLKQQNQTRKAA